MLLANGYNNILNNWDLFSAVSGTGGETFGWFRWKVLREELLQAHKLQGEAELTSKQERGTQVGPTQHPLQGVVTALPVWASS